MGARQIGVSNEEAYTACARLTRPDRVRCDELAEAIDQFARFLVEDEVDFDCTDVGEIARATFQAFRLAYATILVDIASLIDDEPGSWTTHAEETR